MAADRDEKLAVLHGLAGNFSATLSPETSKLWLFLLADYSVQQVQAAALAMIRRCGTDEVPYKTMPPFALLQRELDAMSGTVRGAKNIQLQARSEWGKLLEAVSAYGSYREPKLCQTTAYCVRAMGGWAQVCRWRTDDFVWRERDFIELWTQVHGKTEAMAQGCEAVALLAGKNGAAALNLGKNTMFLGVLRGELMPITARGTTPGNGLADDKGGRHAV